MSTMAGISTSPSDLRDGEADPVYLLTRRRSSIPPAPARSPSVPEESVVRRAKRREPDGSIESWTALETAEVVAPQNAASVRPVAESRPSAPYDEAWDEDDASDDEASDVRFIRRTTRRSRAIRVLGTLAVLGTLGGGAFVLQQPKVRREALSFVTLGHEETAARLGHQIASLVAGLRGK